MGKFAVVFLIEVLVILPIVLEGRFHGHDSYKQYYNHRVNGGLQNPTTASLEIPKESFYDVKEVKSTFEDKNANKHNSGLSDEWQARIGSDNYAIVPRCDYLKQTFCEDVPYYPQTYVKQMLAKNSSLLNYANEDVIALTPRFDNDEEPLCLSTERLIRPKTAVNIKDQWMYIVQSDNFLQTLRIEACTEEDAKCRMIDGFAEGYITTCKQKYIYRELSAISADGEPIRDFFRVPASCCCHVEFKAEDEMARIRSVLGGLPSSNKK
ncbi:uncharacterized protein LOC105840398 [Monomorium pharaonis]|uniref:uncharacterized protein LOC105840398 n=1 Tax=Monomorium pharaonis TaxID=307658 RepID=UPI00063F295E|nr:uncharacterized protein LOC105840398 [Monomorium pharaonis]